ncbi:MAG: Grx4 family monothiol glutaredoxin [Gammaproteobacteria bacterium]|nr:Grx4 family monothiol glutaredoxin [Gammaproteobacteria bacterium]
MKTSDKIRRQLAENPIILYMKGTPDQPRCGFSAKAARCLEATGIPFAYVDVLSAPLIMQALPEVSDFPTFPQLFVNGEIIGGSDIIEEMSNSNELVPLLQSSLPSGQHYGS